METLVRKSISKKKTDYVDDSSPKRSDRSFISSLCHECFIKPKLWVAVCGINMFFIYLGALFLLFGHQFKPIYCVVYFPILSLVLSMRRVSREKIRLQNAHRIPFFADAVANALSVGNTLEQSLNQSLYYLKGEIKSEFEKLILKCSLGKDIGVLLRDIDAHFPNTGLRYMISLLEQYRELGVGISPLLKKIAIALTVKEEAEEKIRAILSTGSSYARLSILVFGLIFMAMTYMLKDQFAILLTPTLKPIFYFLITWTLVGLFIVSRITSIDFTRNYALRPYVRHYLEQKSFTTEALMKYSGIKWSEMNKIIFYLSPGVIGFLTAYIVSWYLGDSILIGIAFLVGGGVGWIGAFYILKGQVEDQLIKTIEIFPDMLQVFIIGLNSGLNTYKAFEFAEQAIKTEAPLILSEELCRTKFAMECGEDHSKTWQRFAEMLPFETVIDFAEIMIASPMHGESIVKSITQISKAYESKKLLIIEKNAIKVSQIVVPVIVLAFFPLFVYTLFAPLLMKITGLLGG